MAGKSEDIREASKLKTGFENPILKEASEILREFIVSEGSVECNKLEETCIRFGSGKGNSDSDHSKAEESLSEASSQETSQQEASQE